MRFDDLDEVMTQVLWRRTHGGKMPQGTAFQYNQPVKTAKGNDHYVRRTVLGIDLIAARTAAQKQLDEENGPGVYRVTIEPDDTLAVKFSQLQTTNGITVIFALIAATAGSLGVFSLAHIWLPWGFGLLLAIVAFPIFIKILGWWFRLMGFIKDEDAEKKAWP